MTIDAKRRRSQHHADRSLLVNRRDRRGSPGRPFLESAYCKPFSLFPLPDQP
jgi:hypothetical protein